MFGLGDVGLTDSDAKGTGTPSRGDLAQNIASTLAILQVTASVLHRAEISYCCFWVIISNACVEEDIIGFTGGPGSDRNPTLGSWRLLCD